jgi:TP901 family phage tail tape measure protein
MAKPFNLTAQLNLVGPTNLRPVVNNLRKQLSGINTNVTVNISRGASRNVRLLNTQVQGLTKSLQQANAQGATLSSTMSTLATSLQKIANSSKATSSNLNNTANAANQVGKSVQQAATQVEEFGRISGLALRRYAGFTVATTVTFGFARAISNAFSEAIKFERELIKVAQVTGNSVSNLKSLTSEIGRLSTSLGVSSTELLEVSRVLAQAGLRANEVRRALSALAKSALAPTFNDIRNTTEGVIAVMSQFSIRARDMEKVLGSLNAVAGSFAVEAEDLISVIRRTGGVFKASAGDIGTPIQQLNQLVAVFTSVRATTRESAESIATGLRTIFTRIQRPTTLKFLRQLGVDLQDLEGKFVGPYKALQILNQALRELDPRDVRFAKIVEQLGGFRQVGKLIPAIQQFGKAQAALSVAMAGQDSLARDAATAQQALSVQITKVREQFLKLVRDVAGDSTFQVFAKGALQLASSLIKVADAFRPVLPVIAALGAIKGASALQQFGTGFFGGIRSAGGAKAVGSGAASAATGTRQTQASQALQNMMKANTTAVQANTKALAALSTIVRNAARAGGSPLRPRLGGSIYPRHFNSGGMVPGTGNYDSVPAMLTPGEFVIKKSAVKSLGTDYLQRANRYNKGGNVFNVNNRPKYGLFAFQRAKKGSNTAKEVVRKIGGEQIKGKAVDNIWEQHSQKIVAANPGITFDKFKEGKAPYPSKVSGTPHVRYLDAGVEKSFVKSVKDNFNLFVDNIIEDAMGARTQKMAVAFNSNPKQLKDSIKTNMQPSTIAGNAFEGFISAISGNVRREAKTSEAQTRFLLPVSLLSTESLLLK